MIERVAQPTFTVYAPAAGVANTGAAVVVLPGGGYRVLAIDLEGTEVCDWLTARGVTCVLLKYRVPASGPHWEPACKCHRDPPVFTALQDAQRAVRLVRAHAAEWHVDPKKVGVLGFSAGGHLAAAVSTSFATRSYARVDAAEDLSARPDFAVVLYPGHMLENTTRDFELNPKMKVGSDASPTFIAQAEDDPVDEVRNSLVYYAALVAAGVPVEMHLYAEGKHAFGLRPTAAAITRWPRLVEAWLVGRGVLTE